MMETANPKLAAALVKAQAAAKAVEKDARNKFHDYAYASAEAVITEARGALNGAGLACVQSGWRMTSVDVEWTDGDGKPQKDQERTLHVSFLVVHESGESMTGEVEVPIIPEKGRPLDKASFGALTFAESYYLRGLLALPRVSETDDIDKRDDTKHEPRSTSRPAAASSRAPKKNAHPGTCKDCGDMVEALAGVLTQGPNGKGWDVRHDESGSCLKRAVPATAAKATPNANDATCSNCDELVPAGKGWTKDGKTVCVTRSCVEDRKEKASKREPVGAGAEK